MGIFVNEFVALYNGEELPGLRIQYKDFSVWQNELFKTDRIKKQEEYWLDTFSGELPLLNLPVDYPRPSLQSFEGDRVNIDTGRELGEKLKHLAAKTGTTLYMVLLSAYYILLSKYTGREDIIVGSPTAGRPHTDLQNLIGMFINTLAMRNFPEGKKKYGEFLKEVKDNALRAYENQDYQFEELVENLNIPRDMSRNPLFDTMFVLQNMDIEGKELSGLKVRPFSLENRTTKFDIAVIAVETALGITFTVDYCGKLFMKESMEEFINEYAKVLEFITMNEEISIKEIIEGLRQDEKDRISAKTVEIKNDILSAFDF